MFYNSTTLFHFTQIATPVVGSNRMVFGLLSMARTGVTYAWSGTKIAARLASKPFKYAIGTRIAKGVGGATIKGAKTGLNVIETAEHTVLEAGKGLFGMTGAPLLTWAGSSIHSVWIKLRHLSVSAVKCALETPLAVLQSPLNLVRGVRDSIVNTFQNTIAIGKGIGSFDVKGILGSTRDLIKGALVPPIARPLVPCLAPAGNVISTAVRSELVKLLGIKKGVDHAVNGANRIRNSYSTAKEKVAIINAEREFEAMQRKQEKEQEEAMAAQKAQQVETQKGRKLAR